jgi:hypothetical protein
MKLVTGCISALLDSESATECYPHLNTSSTLVLALTIKTSIFHSQDVRVCHLALKSLNLTAKHQAFFSSGGKSV